MICSSPLLSVQYKATNPCSNFRVPNFIENSIPKLTIIGLIFLMKLFDWLIDSKLQFFAYGCWKNQYFVNCFKNCKQTFFLKLALKQKARENYTFMLGNVWILIAPICRSSRFKMLLSSHNAVRLNTFWSKNINIMPLLFLDIITDKLWKIFQVNHD